MTKPKNKKPGRYWLVWLRRCGRRMKRQKRDWPYLTEPHQWVETVRQRKPKHAHASGHWATSGLRIRVVDLLTGEIPLNTLDLRETAYVATTRWPKRETARRALGIPVQDVRL